MPLHRIAGFTDEDIAQYWADASEFFVEYAGVDFRDIPVGEDGFKHMEGWSIMSFVVQFGLRVPWSSAHGEFPCPVEVLDEGLALVPTQEGMVYHGSYGGEDGIAAVVNDVNPFGHYFIDLDQDESTPLSRWHYEANGPMRLDDQGLSFIDCLVFSDEYGPGRNEGTFDFNTPGEDGKPHVSSRGVLTFPARFQF